ncbi:DEAD/DEAH box helicase [Mucilaginibacter psychrotolerans]|uniref:DEAD/DEAH box helicase n=1 Tax=Mucilaginibacter psychrotolerans TaxID=1524096 RepID=A0A4Y8SCW7_9SPHI|nr:DEAD/DEAH box helicase [Mucilaginibacter psychrotolerans]TFF36186.1 DEAD/DEAH box helicase [Mucilaginibacter psychrotolerans]
MGNGGIAQNVSTLNWEIMEMNEAKEVLNELLKIDLRSNALKFKFIPSYKFELNRDFVSDAIGVLDKLSQTQTEEADRYLVVISALFWTYAKPQWAGLQHYLILFLTRRGFAPTATMLDDGYGERKSFAGGGSLMNQFAISLGQISFEIWVAGRSFLITSFQKEVWDAITAQQMVGISAPTSAGKSYIILIKMMALLLEKKGTMFYIVPTLSLVAQVATDVKQQISSFQLEMTVETNYNPQRYTDNTIYVLTQGKAIAAFSQEERPFRHLRLLVVDEIQNVERVADANDQRAKILFDLMTEIKNSLVIDKIVISGPRVTNIDRLGKDIFGIDGYGASTRNSPVVNLTYALKKISNKEYRFKLYCDLNPEPLSLKIENQRLLEGYGQTRYTKKYMGFFNEFMACFDAGESNIIFSPTAGASRKMAEELRLSTDSINNPYLQELAGYLSETVHVDFALSNTVLGGIAYHNGKLPHHVRNAIEDGIRKQQIRNIVCTTTLLQGVNLPVKNIIIRNPNLSLIAHGGEQPKLTSYETANLRGRAGRLLKDFIGRTYVMDEDSFSKVDDRQTSLFENTEKNITVGYKDAFEGNKKNILNDLETGAGQTTANSDYSYLLTYVRQTILKYGSYAALRLKEVGIQLEPELVQAEFAILDKLEVDRKICLANRYWDPLDLNRMWQLSEKWVMPTSAAESFIASKLKNILLELKQYFPVYYNRLFDIQETDNGDPLLSACWHAENWLKGHSLKSILSGEYYDTNDKIERAIIMLQNKIAFGLPMLLKPLYDMRAPGQMFLRFIELGAYQPMIRRLIDLNIPRETAIAIDQKYSLGDADDIPAIKRALEAIKSQLSYFDQVQLQLL